MPASPLQCWTNALRKRSIWTALKGKAHLPLDMTASLKATLNVTSEHAKKSDAITTIWSDIVHDTSAVPDYYSSKARCSTNVGKVQEEKSEQENVCLNNVIENVYLKELWYKRRRCIRCNGSCREFAGCCFLGQPAEMPASEWDKSDEVSKIANVLNTGARGSRGLSSFQRCHY